jgi:type IV pilus assembly protein PilC
MSAAGMSLLRALGVLEDQTEKSSLKKAINDVRLDVEGGMPLSAAMSKHDRVFPGLMVAMVRSGETGGFLDDALERIAASFEKDAALRGKIKSALTYPVMVLAFSVVMIAAVLIFIVPVFEKMFKELGGELPLPTQIIVSASNTIAWSLPLTVVLVMIGTALFKRELRNRPTLRLRFDRLKLRLPVFGPLFTKIAISRFARNLGTLLGVGIPVMQALGVVGGTTGNAVIAEAMKDLQASVRDGLPMSAPLQKHTIFPRMVTQMMEVGEESGQISQMLEKIADFYDREVDDAAEALTAALEPIMVLFMGALIGGMVVCLYLPMFSVYQNIQGVE